MQQATSRQPSPRTTPTPGESLSIHVPPLAPISPHYHRHHRHRHQDDDEQGWDSEDDEEQDDDETSIHRDLASFLAFLLHLPLSSPRSVTPALAPTRSAA
jgi:hypothetical protein